MTAIRSDALVRKKSMLDTRIDGFYLVFALFVVSQYVTFVNYTEAFSSAVDSAMDILRALVLIALIGMIFFRHSKNFDLLVRNGALLAVSGLTWIVGGSSYLFWIIAFTLAAKKISISKVAKLVFVATLAIAIFTIVLWQLGVVEESTLGNTESRMRSTFGFRHPNTLGLVVFLMAFSYSVMHFGRLPLAESFLCLVYFFISSYFADSRTYALITMTWLVVLWIRHVFGSNKRVSQSLPLVLLIAFIGLFAISMFLMANYNPDNSLQSLLDRMLSGRLWFMHSYYLDSPLSLLGYSYEGAVPRYSRGIPYFFLVDNAYSYIYLRCGLVGTLIVLVGVFRLVGRCRKERYNGVLLYGLIFFTLVAFVELSACQIACDFFLLAFSALSTGQPLAEIDDVSDQAWQKGIARVTDGE